MPLEGSGPGTERMPPGNEAGGQSKKAGKGTSLFKQLVPSRSFGAIPLPIPHACSKPLVLCSRLTLGQRRFPLFLEKKMSRYFVRFSGRELPLTALPTPHSHVFLHQVLSACTA